MHIIWFVLVLLVLSSSIRAGTLGDLTYAIADGQVTITGCDRAAAGKLEIPAEIDGARQMNRRGLCHGSKMIKIRFMHKS